MRVFAAEEIQKLITPGTLVEVLRRAFQADLVCPPRQIVASAGRDTAASLPDHAGL